MNVLLLREKVKLLDRYFQQEDTRHHLESFVPKDYVQHPEVPSKTEVKFLTAGKGKPCKVRQEIQQKIWLLEEFDEVKYVSTTYLGTYPLSSSFECEIKLPLDQYVYTVGHTFNKDPLRVFFDSGATGTYLSAQYFNSHNYLHSPSKNKSRTSSIKVGNGEFIKVRFGIQLPIVINNQAFEIYCLVAELPTLDLVVGIKAWKELEATLDTREWHFKLLNRSPVILPIANHIIGQGSKRLIKCEVNFQKN